MDLVPPPEELPGQQPRRTVQCTDGAWGVVRNTDAVSTLLLTVSSCVILVTSERSVESAKHPVCHTTSGAKQSLVVLIVFI